MESRALRIAFLTSEFVTEDNSGGGLSNYVNRITQALKDLGHEPEVFVHSYRTPRVVDWQGVRVERVRPVSTVLLRVSSFLLIRVLRLQWLSTARTCLAMAIGLSRALERRHQEAPFDLVQSPNNFGIGLFVTKDRNRPHLVRMSSQSDLWGQTDGRWSRGSAIRSLIERQAVRRADVVYTPSEYLADQCRRSWRKDVRVSRPPVFVETEPLRDFPGPRLPDRYLIYFGQIGPRKGSDVLAAALRLAWQQEPELKMIWAGKPIQPGDYERCVAMWGQYAANVVWLGSVPKQHLYAILQDAEGAVLPSRVDNLPNTVIESLMFGVPVIGSNGASIDELVEPGVSGDLVPIGNEKMLAERMVSLWRREVPWTKQGFRTPAILQEMAPHTAASNLLKVAGLGIPRSTANTHLS